MFNSERPGDGGDDEGGKPNTHDYKMRIKPEEGLNMMSTVKNFKEES